MARYIKAFQVFADAQDIFNEISRYLQGEGYEYMELKGENVFKKTNGAFSAPTFFKFSLSGSRLRMETWSQKIIFPGIFIGESAFKGESGKKEDWKKRVDTLEQMLTSFGSANARNKNAGKADAYFEEDDDFGATQLLQATPDTGAFCPHCGTALPTGSMFCTACGKPV